MTKLIFQKIIIILIVIGLLPIQVFWSAIIAKAQKEKQASVMNAEAFGPVQEREDTSFNGIVRKLKKESKINAYVIKMKKPKIVIDQYDDAEILSKTIIISEMIENDSLYKAEYQRTGKVPEKLLQELDIAFDPNKIDKRIIESLINLVLPKDIGGGGREYIKIGSITRGYSSKATDSPLKEADEEQLKKESAETISHFNSAHSKETGQAADITEVDLLRGTKFVYEDNELKEKTKLDPIPIKVAWQTDKGAGRIEDVPEIMGQNVDKMAGNMFSQVFNSTLKPLLSERGIDINNLGNLGTNLANMVQNLGFNWYKENWELPTGTRMGADLGNMGLNMGQEIMEEMTGGIIPSSGFEGNNSSEMLLNAGREVTARKMGLPEYSFKYGGNNSHELLESIGQRYMEKNLDLSPGSLKDSNESNIKERIGQGFIEHQLNFAPGSFSGKTVSEIKSKIGEQKFQELISYAEYIDGLLYLDIGTTSSLLNNSPEAFKKKVGERVIERRILVYEKGSDGSNRRDEAFGIADPDYKGLIDRFTIGAKDVYFDIGVSVSAKALTMDTGEQKLIGKWFKEGEIEKDPEKDNLEKLDEEGLAEKVGLKKYDLWRIFVYSQGNEVFARKGQVAWLAALAPAYDENANGKVSQSPNSGFYLARFKEIKDRASQINKSVKNQTAKNMAQDIYNLALEMESYASYGDGLNLDNLDKIVYPLNEAAKKNISLILGKLTEIEKIEKSGASGEWIRKKSYEIIEKRELRDLSGITKDDLTGLSRPYFVEPTYKDNLFKVAQGQKSITDFTRELGLVNWGTVAGLDNPTDLVRAYSSIAANPSKNPLDILKSVVGIDQLKGIRDQFNSGFGLAPWGSSSDYYKITENDVAGFLVGQMMPFISKLGSYAFDQATYFLPGFGSKEIIRGSIDINTATKYSGLNRLTKNVLGLIEDVSTSGDIIKNVTNLYLSENLGLPQKFTTDFNNFAKDDRNKVKILRAFGIRIPENLGSDWSAIVKWANTNQPWNEQTDSIKSQVGFLKLPVDGIKQFLTNVASGNSGAAQTQMNELYKYVKEGVSEYITLDKINEGIGLDKAREKGIDFLDFLPPQIKQLKDAFDKGDSGQFLAMLGLAGINKIMTDSNLPSDSGAIGDPKTAGDLAAISTILATLAAGKGKDKNAMKDAFIIAGMQIVGNHAPEALDYAGKIIAGIKMFETFAASLDEFGRKNRGDELSQSLADGLTKDVLPVIMTAGQLFNDASTLFGSGGGNFPFFSAMTSYAGMLQSYSKIAEEAGISLSGDKKDMSLAAFGGKNPSYEEGRQGVVILKETSASRFYTDADSRQKAWINEFKTDLKSHALNLRSAKEIEFRQKMREEQQRLYFENMLIAQMDMQLMKMGAPPLAMVMLRGNENQKKEAIRQTMVYYLLRGTKLPAWGAAAVDILSRSLINGQKVDSKQLGLVIDMALADVLKLDFLPMGLGEGFAEYINSGDDKKLMTSLKDGAILYGTTFLDKSLNLPSGTTYSMYNMYNTYQTAAKAYQTAVIEEVKYLGAIDKFIDQSGGLTPDLVKNSNLQELNDKYLKLADAKDAALKNMQLQSANIAVTAVNMLLGKTFAKMEQDMGLPSGTISLIVSAVIYGTIGGLGMSAIAGMLWPAAAVMLLGGLFGGEGGVLGRLFCRKNKN